MSQFYEYGQTKQSGGPTGYIPPQRNELAGSEQYEPLQSDQQQEFQRPGGFQEPFYNQGQQSYMPPMADAQHPGFSFLDINSRLAAFLSYTSFWLTGLLFLLFENRNRFVRFHAMQSMLFFGGVQVLYILLISIMVNKVPFLVGPAIFAFVIMNIVALVAWIVGMVGAIRGRYVKLPLVGDIAERYVNRDATVK